MIKYKPVRRVIGPSVQIKINLNQMNRVPSNKGKMQNKKNNTVINNNRHSMTEMASDLRVKTRQRIFMTLTSNLRSLIILVACLTLMSGCGSLYGGLGSDEDTSSYSESNEEAMVTAAIESLTSASSSSTSAASSASSSLTKSNYLVADSETAAQTAHLKHRFRCEDVTSVTESFSCNNSDGSMTRAVTFEDCDLTNSHKSGYLNGTFTNTIENGGDGLCASFTRIDFASMVMGRTDEDLNPLDAIHTHTIGEEGLVHTLDEVDEDVTITTTGSRTTTFTDPLDEDKDGAAESVTATVAKEINRVTTVNGEEKHDVTVSTQETSFIPVDEEGAEQDEVALTYPIHTLTLDEDGKVDSRTVESGQMIIDRNNSSLRIIMDVGEDGLSFYGVDDDECGPETGTMIITGYTLNDDGNYVEAGTGSVVYEDGTIQTSEYEGVELNLKPKPCS
jgi:hypothetical protein